jgi:diacylglycerol kinase family enzyme
MNNLSRFDRCLIVINPSSSSYKRSDKLIASLEAAFQTKEVVKFRVSKTELNSGAKLRRELRKLDKSSLLAVIGGDGTVNAVVSELFRLKESGPKNTTLLPLWGGNACDLAHMANGRRRNSARNILEAGKIVSMHPLEYALHNATKQETGIALCYVSFGAVAHAAKQLEDSKVMGITKPIPGVRLVTEIGIGLKGLSKAKRFNIAAERKEKVYDLVYVNGPRIAKLYRTPARLTSKGFVELKVRHKYPLFVTHVSKLTRVWLRSTKAQKRELQLQQPTWMQYDGEVQRLDAKTAVRIKSARQSVRLLATK